MTEKKKTETKKTEAKKAKAKKPEAKKAEVKKPEAKSEAAPSMDYGALLKRAEDMLPHETQEEEERFKLPAPNVKIQGNRTYVANLTEIANLCGRKPEHLLKFLSRELATFGNAEGAQVVFVGKFSYNVVKDKILMYFREFVKCPECGKPDTKIIKEERQPVMRCMACGAKHPVRSL